MKKKWNIILPILLSAVLILAGGIYYISSVQGALWNKAVMDILEVTAQGRHALDTYIEKDMEMVHLLASELGEESSSDAAALQEKLRLSGNPGASYVCVDLDRGIAYTNLLEERHSIDDDLLETFRSLRGRGTRPPFLDGYTGVWMIGCYERFTFSDGGEGYVQKTQPRADIADRFSLSFYNNTGFSYVVNQEGDILIRSLHRNSNRTFQNLFDIIDLQGNGMRDVDSFRNALQDGKKGAARFQYQGENYVFCYVPMETVDGWYVVSIIPNRVIMEQANRIIQHSQILIIFILAGVFALLAFFLVYRNSMRRIFLAEEEARKAAESANLAKSNFLSNMSHDIRTPMNAVIGMTKLASDHVDDPDKVREYLKKIGLSSRLLVSLINDILDMSKIESGKMVLNNDNASLVKLLTDLVNIVQPTIWQKGLRFDIRMHQVEHEMLYFDVLRLNQVLMNLISNAMKFTPEGGSIGVDVTESASQREGCTHFTFRVSDTGIGMKPEFLKDIFHSFTREQDSRVNKTEGSGLGMAITKMIVDIMEGSITVESEPGKGTVFTVELDLLLAPDITREMPPLPAVRVLVADDDPSTCRSAERILRELGVDAVITTKGKDAVEKVLEACRAGKPYNLILLDWKMPDMNGVETARAIREQIGDSVPIVILSAYEWAHIELEATEAGVIGFLPKPFFKSTLYRCIRQYALHDDTPGNDRKDKVDLTGKRLLVAEDNQLNQEIAQELLESAGAQVELVGNGLACLERFEQSEPGYFDLILMDVHMPVMDGHEATRRLRKLPRPDAASIPIFAMTADAFAEDIAAAKEAGMNRHLAKPLDIPAMLREIQLYLDALKEQNPSGDASGMDNS